MDIAAAYPLKFASQLHGAQPVVGFPELYRQEASGLSLSREAAIQLLAWELASYRQRRAGFLQKLRSASSKLSALLHLHGHSVDNNPKEQGGLAFARDLIAFDKLEQLTASKEREFLPDSRVQRIEQTLHQLVLAQDIYDGPGVTVFTSPTTARTYELENQLDGVVGELARVGEACAQARARQQQNMQQLVNTVAALRMSELFLNYTYEDSLHDAYFEHFGLSHLTTEDLQYLPLLLVIEDSRQLQRQAGDLLALWTNNSQVKVLGINPLETLFARPEQGGASHLELASLIIMRRNAYVYQGGLEAPSRLQEAYTKGLAFPGPVFWNVLLPAAAEMPEHLNFLSLQAAAESRFFPRLEYLTENNHFAAQQISLEDNPDPAQPFPVYTPLEGFLRVDESKPLVFTMADFLAMNQEWRADLQPLPAADSAAVPVADYHLRTDPGPVAGQKTYIYLADEQQAVHPVVVPPAWLQLGAERLEYWRILQTLAGTPSARPQAAVGEEAAPTITAREEDLKADPAQLHKAELQQTLVRILYRLLDQDVPLTETLAALSQGDAPGVVESPVPESAASNAAEAATIVEEERPAPAVREEAWVESEDCTSCGDCINALSAVFQYNEDQQAYVHNPQGGTFAQIVTVAERCPAACIHPGKPQNEAEAELEKWLKRAAKFN